MPRTALSLSDVFACPLWSVRQSHVRSLALLDLCRSLWHSPQSETTPVRESTLRACVCVRGRGMLVPRRPLRDVRAFCVGTAVHHGLSQSIEELGGSVDELRDADGDAVRKRDTGAALGADRAPARLVLARLAADLGRARLSAGARRAARTTVIAVGPATGSSRRSGRFGRGSGAGLPSLGVERRTGERGAAEHQHGGDERVGSLAVGEHRVARRPQRVVLDQLDALAAVISGGR